MRNIWLIAVLPAVCISALSGCVTSSVYVPTTQIISNFDTPRQYRLSAFYTAGHAEMHAAYNPSHRFVAAGGISFGTGVAAYSVAGGGYQAWGRRRRWRGEMLLGAGYSSNLYLYSTSRTARLNRSSREEKREMLALYNSYFLQPAFGYHWRYPLYTVEASYTFGVRASLQHFRLYTYREVDEASTTDRNNPVYSKNITFRNKDLLLLEPCFNHTITWKKISFLTQLQCYLPYPRGDFSIDGTDFAPKLFFNTGLQYRFPGRRGK